jgi:hypothetical protein
LKGENRENTGADEYTEQKKNQRERKKTEGTRERQNVRKRKQEEQEKERTKSIKEAEERSFAQHLQILVQSLYKPGKFSFSPVLHFNYLVAVAGVREQFTHACG